MNWISRPTATFFALCAVTVSAQPTVPAKSGVVAHVEGVVFIDEQRVEASAVPFPIKAHTVMRTEKGRAEIHLSKDGSLFLGENSSVRQIDSGGYKFSRLAILTGSAVLVTGANGSLVDCEDAAKLSDSGVYRFDFNPIRQSTENVCRFRVYKGAAAVQLPTTIAVLTPGKTMGLNRLSGDMIPTQAFNTEDIDALDNWTRQRVQLRRP